jgi:hypothetical protein
MYKKVEKIVNQKYSGNSYRISPFLVQIIEITVIDSASLEIYIISTSKI